MIADPRTAGRDQLFQWVCSAGHVEEHHENQRQRGQRSAQLQRGLTSGGAEYRDVVGGQGKQIYTVPQGVQRLEREIRSGPSGV